MILRRIAEAFKNQDWFVVALEVMIVVVGIFIGLQVDDWNDDRKEAIVAEQFMQRLHADFEMDIAKMDHRRKFWSQVIEQADIAINHAETRTLTDPTGWTEVLAWFQASQIGPFQVTNITYYEMQSAGQLGLISNQELRSKLAFYYSFNDSLGIEAVLQLLPKYREMVRGLFPSKVTDYIWANCHQVLELDNQIMYDCPSPITQQEAQEILDILVANDILLLELRSWKSTLIVADDLIDVNYVRAREILEIIQDELSK